MTVNVLLWVRAGDRESDEAQRFLRQHGFRADEVRDLVAHPPRGPEWQRLQGGLGGELWPLVDARHPRYGELLPRGAEDLDGDGLRALLEANPSLVRAPLLLTPKGALAGFRERAWSRFLGVGVQMRG